MELDIRIKISDFIDDEKFKKVFLVGYQIKEIISNILKADIVENQECYIGKIKKV